MCVSGCVVGSSDVVIVVMCSFSVRDTSLVHDYLTSSAPMPLVSGAFPS